MAAEPPDPEEIQFARTENWEDLARSGVDSWNRGIAWLMDQPEDKQPRSARFSSLPVDDFRGFVFPPFFSFSRITYRVGVTFKEAVFQGDADFRHAVFLGSVSFQGATFGCAANFEKVEFRGGVDFHRASFQADADFRESRVLGNTAVFEEAKFGGNAQFDRVRFDHASANFNGAAFLGDASFDGANFAGGATFAGESVFSGPVVFSGAEFADHADFTGATFVKDCRFVTGKIATMTALFDRATFKGSCEFFELDLARYMSLTGTVFERDVVFSVCTFGETTTFASAHFKRGATFAGSEFDGFASFDSCHFGRPPILRATRFKHPPSFLDASFELLEGASASAEYRHLKRLAAEAHDHRRELDLFALESRARLASLTWKKHWIELALGRAYECTSNYGRSVLRPSLWLLATFLLCVVAFQSLLGLHWKVWDWSEAALVASASSLLPFAGQTYIGRKVMEEGLCWDQSLHCLAWIYRISAVEGLFAVVFLFLLVVGIRNLFRIK